MKYAKLLTFINNMRKEDFYDLFVKGVGSTKLFSHFVTDPKFTSEVDKKLLRDKFINAGIPAELIATDDDLYAAAKISMARAVEVR